MSPEKKPGVLARNLRRYRRRHPEKLPRVIERINPISVSLDQRPWDAQGMPLHDQLIVNTSPNSELPTYRGEGLLMQANTEQLRAVFQTIVTEQGDPTRRDPPWTPAEQQLVLDVAKYIAVVHEGQNRTDGFTPYEHHLLRTASRAAQLKMANPFMVAVALLHDAPEDRGVTLELMQNHFVREKGYDNETITMLFAGANALNNQRGGIELPLKQYYQNINDTNKDYPNLHLWVIKGLDRLDSFNSDLSATLRAKEFDGVGRIRLADAFKLKRTAEEKLFPIQ